MNRVDVVAEVLAEAVTNQPFYRKYSNTINASLAAIVGALISLIAFWQTSGTNTTLVSVLLIFTPILTGIVTRLTKNGISDSVQARIVSQAESIEVKEQKAYEDTLPVELPVFKGDSVADLESTFINTDGRELYISDTVTETPDTLFDIDTSTKDEYPGCEIIRG